MAARKQVAVTQRGRSRPPGAARAALRCGVFVVDPERVRRGRDTALPEDVTAEVAGTFKVLAHTTRIRIIRALSQGELCVCELSEVVGLSLSATSHQLQLLRNLRLVRARAEGKLVYYTVSDPFVLALLGDCTRHVESKSGRGSAAEPPAKRRVST